MLSCLSADILIKMSDTRLRYLQIAMLELWFGKGFCHISSYLNISEQYVSKLMNVNLSPLMDLAELPEVAVVVFFVGNGPEGGGTCWWSARWC